MSNVYKHCQKHHGYRAKNKDVRIDHEKLQVIRDKLNYNYFGKTAQSAQNKEKSWPISSSTDIFMWITKLSVLKMHRYIWTLYI
jgi:hypothetical protein